MEFNALLVQLLNGLAQASTLFLMAAGLSLIFGVTRIVNFAHGSFYMLGLYASVSLFEHLSHRWAGSGASGSAWFFWQSVVWSGVLTAALGALVEVLVIKRLSKASDIVQLLGTFALVLIIKDASLWFWGAEDLMGPRAPGLKGAVYILGRAFPSYDLLLIAVGPLGMGALWWILTKTRFGVLVRAASLDRDMVAALGVNQRWLFTGVFALGCALAGWAGALQMPREPANLSLDLTSVSEAFVVVVVGGLGSIPGAYLAALLIAETKALCMALGTVDRFGLTLEFSKLTLVAEFLVMASVLVFKPWGLMGRPIAAKARAEEVVHENPSFERVWMAYGLALAFMVLWALPLLTHKAPYATVLAIDVLTSVLFASSLRFLMGPAGLHSFGHAAYFGLGAYGAALITLKLHWGMGWALLLAPMLSALVAAVVGWFCVQLSGIYLAMLTLAFAQIVWSIGFQWDDITGGSNGLSGIWPSPQWASKEDFYRLTLGLVGLSLFVLYRLAHSPFGYALRASRDSSLRAQALGIDVKRLQWTGFVVAAVFAGLAGALFAFSKGSISPEVLGISKSVDALVMVLLGGLEASHGPALGALIYTTLADHLQRATPYWQAALGVLILFLVLLRPEGLAGFLGGCGRRHTAAERAISRP